MQDASLQVLSRNPLTDASDSITAHHPTRKGLTPKQLIEKGLGRGIKPVHVIGHIPKKYEKKHSFLPNLPVSEFVCEGTKYHSVHAFFLAKAFRFAARHDSQQTATFVQVASSIAAVESVSRAVEIAQMHEGEISNETVALWDLRKSEVMLTALKYQFTACNKQAKKYRTKLLSTGEAYLVNEDSNDRFWGVTSDYLDGQNVLGGLLMQIRDALQRKWKREDNAKRVELKAKVEAALKAATKGKRDPGCVVM